jgi:hypothetical protein
MAFSSVVVCRVMRSGQIYVDFSKLFRLVHEIMQSSGKPPSPDYRSVFVNRDSTYPKGLSIFNTAGEKGASRKSSVDKNISDLIPLYKAGILEQCSKRICNKLIVVCSVVGL